MTSVTNNSISLAWVPPDVSGNNSSSANVADNYTDFVIQYGKVNNMTMYETVVKLEHVSLYFFNLFSLWNLRNLLILKNGNF